MSSPSETETLTPTDRTQWPEWVPYVMPMAVFLVLTALEAQIPLKDGRTDTFWYPMSYALKVAVVAVVAWFCRSAWTDLRPWPGWVAAIVAIGTGLVVAVLWVGLDPIYPRFAIQGSRSAFDPGSMTDAGRWGFLSVRFLGLVVLVPLIEELFWRSFLIRYIIDPDFQRVPIGRVTPSAAAISAALFALAHPEWLPALLTGLLWAGLLWWSRSVSACVLSHATANLALGVYVLATGEWAYL